MKIQKGAALVAMTLIAGGLLWTSVGAGQQQATELESVFVSTPPMLDGVAESLWDNVPELGVSVVAGANAGTHAVSVKSVYTNADVYFLVSWDDPTHSLQRFPWVKQADGSWLQLNDGSDHDEKIYYEDKFAFIWNINNSIAGFNSAGCMVTCHTGEAGKAYGNKYTATAGEKGDIWHWKSVRSGSIGYIDDQYVDDRRWAADNDGAGRHSDPKAVGGYENNVNGDGTGPAFMGPQGADGPYWIKDSDKIPFVDTFEAGDEIPGIIVSRPDGDRGQIDGLSTYAGGKWTLEIRRARVTGSEFDVQFDDMTAAYHFGVAVFDNAQVRHAFQPSVAALRFGDRPTLIADMTWGEVKAAMSQLK